MFLIINSPYGTVLFRHAAGNAATGNIARSGARLNTPHDHSQHMEKRYARTIKKELMSVSGGEDPLTLPPVIVNGPSPSGPSGPSFDPFGPFGPSTPTPPTSSPLPDIDVSEPDVDITCENHTNDDLDNAANEVRDIIASAPNSENVEYGAILVETSNGLEISNSPGNQGQTLGVFTTNSPDSGTIPFFGDPADIRATVHNHPGVGDNLLGQLFSRYPSEGDWEAAEQLVSLGAPADELSLYIIDSFGELREFEYSDRAIYEDLTQGQKQSEFNLPPSVSEEGVTTEHCAPQAS